MSLFQLGYMRVADAMRTGDDLGALMSDMINNRCHPDAIGGALYYMVSVIDASKKAGLRFSSKDAEINKFLCAPKDTMCFDLSMVVNSADRKKCERILSALTSSVHHAGKLCTLKITTPKSSKSKESGPLRVEIVSVPGTTSIQSVQRDENDEITQTMTTTAMTKF